jgi:hypothetical protein
MADLKKLEEFIVNTDDVISLMEMYATRIKSYPDNRAYYRALVLQCGEFLLAAKQLGHPVVQEVGTLLHQLIKLLDEKLLPATTRQMEVFIEEIQDLTTYLKRLFTDPEASFAYASHNLTLLKNYIRKVTQEKARTVDAGSAQPLTLVEDPFDEMEGFGDFVDSFLDDLDDAFDALVQPADAGAPGGIPGQLQLTENEQNEVENLFLSISSAYLQPVKDFISELQAGSVSKGWVDICLSSVRMIEDAGTKMSYEKMNQIVERFKQLMLRAKLSDSPYISREIRLQLLKEYANLTTLLPEAFATSDTHASRGTIRDTVIINAILRKTPGIGPVSRNKLIAAGMNTLDKYFVANRKDLAAVTGLNETQAEAICRAFAVYKSTLPKEDTPASRAQSAITKLFKHVKELKALHESYKELTRRALHDQDCEGERGKIRQARQQAMWEISILLAELDAVGMIEDFRKMIFDRRLQRLDEYIKAEAARLF